MMSPLIRQTLEPPWQEGSNDGHKFTTYIFKESTLTVYTLFQVTFDPEIFFNVFLPVIIFEAGFSMKRVSCLPNQSTLYILLLNRVFLSQE